MGDWVKEIDIDQVPEDLKVLLPEERKEIIVIGEKAYELYPCPEKVVEKISAKLVRVMGEIFNPNVKCEKCGKEYILEMGENPPEKCECGSKKFKSMAKNPIEAFVDSEVIPEIISILIGKEKYSIQKAITTPQIKHIAAVFYKQNFSDEILPEKTRKNFQSLLNMIGLGEMQRLGRQVIPEEVETQQKSASPKKEKESAS